MIGDCRRVTRAVVRFSIYQGYTVLREFLFPVFIDVDCSIMFRPALFTVLILTIAVVAKKSAPDEKPDWAKKDIRDFSDVDLERLLDQWEVDIALL